MEHGKRESNERHQCITHLHILKEFFILFVFSVLFILCVCLCDGNMF